MADDNVLLANSTKPPAALQQRGMQFRLMTYPGAKHACRRRIEETVYTLIADYFDEKLKPDGGAPACGGKMAGFHFATTGSRAGLV